MPRFTVLASLMDSCSHTKFSPFIKILDGSHTIEKIGTLVGRKRTLEMNSGSHIGSITSWQVIFENLNYSRISFLVDQMGIAEFFEDQMRTKCTVIYLAHSRCLMLVYFPSTLFLL